jgi:hypothetical protein
MQDQIIPVYNWTTVFSRKKKRKVIFLSGREKNKLLLLAFIYILFYYNSLIGNIKAGDH